MFAHSPSAVDGKKERAFCLADALEEVGRAEEKMQRMAEHALPGQPDAELAADGAGRAIAADEIVGLDAFRARRFRDRRSRS